MDRKTELENQILGSFPRLEPELLLASSARGPGAAAAAMSAERRQLIQALMDREFNRDDIDELKREQVLGEGRDGLLAWLRSPAEAQRRDLARQLLAQENHDRMIIMRQVIATQPKLGPGDLAIVQRVFHRLQVAAARSGERVQRADGTWTTVKARPPQVRR